MYNVKVLQDHPNRSISEIGDKLSEMYHAAETEADQHLIDDFAKELAPVFDSLYDEGYESGLGHGYSNGIAELRY